MSHRLVGHMRPMGPMVWVDVDGTTACLNLRTFGRRRRTLERRGATFTLLGALEQSHAPIPYYRQVRPPRRRW